MKTLTLIMLTLMTFIGGNKRLTCSDLRTGTFTDKSKTGVVIRTTKKQTETYKTSKINIDYEFNIVWTDKCEYLLIVTKTNQPKKPFSIGDTCRVKIKDLFEDKYTFEITYKTQTIKEELYKVR